jgi:hypothetical protein
MFHVFQMFQRLYIDVAKVDRDVAHVVRVIHVCFICSSECCKCVYLDVAKVDLNVAYTCML